MKSVFRRWWAGLLIFALAVIFAVLSSVAGNIVAGVALGLFLVVFAVAVSPALFPRSPGWAEGERRAAATGLPLILWKPGCSWCIRMRLALGLAGNRAVWVDIWADPAAAAATRELNHGNETTPTVITPEQTRTNPEPVWVRTQLPPSR